MPATMAPMRMMEDELLEAYVAEHPSEGETFVRVSQTIPKAAPGLRQTILQRAREWEQKKIGMAKAAAAEAQQKAKQAAATGKKQHQAADGFVKAGGSRAMLKPLAPLGEAPSQAPMGTTAQAQRGAAGQAGAGGYVPAMAGAAGGGGAAGQPGAGGVMQAPAPMDMTPTAPEAAIPSGLGAAGESDLVGETLVTPMVGGGAQGRPAYPAEHEAAMEGRVRAPEFLPGGRGPQGERQPGGLIMTHPKIGPEPTPAPTPTAPEPAPGSPEAVVAAFESDLKGEQDTLDTMLSDNATSAERRQKPLHTPAQVNAQRNNVREARKDLAQEQRRVADEQKKAAQDQEQAAKAERSDAATRIVTRDLINASPKEIRKVLIGATKNPDIPAEDMARLRTFAAGQAASRRAEESSARESAKIRQIADTAAAKAKFVKVWEPTYNSHMTQLEKQLQSAKPQAKEGLVDQTMRSMIQLFRKQREEALKQPPERQEEMLAAAVAQFRTFKDQLPTLKHMKDPSQETLALIKKAFAEAKEKDTDGNWVAISPSDRRARQKAYAAVMVAYANGEPGITKADLDAAEDMLTPFQSDSEVTDDDPRLKKHLKKQ